MTAIILAFILAPFLPLFFFVLLVIGIVLISGNSIFLILAIKIKKLGQVYKDAFYVISIIGIIAGFTLVFVFVFNKGAFTDNEKINTETLATIYYMGAYRGDFIYNGKTYKQISDYTFTYVERDEAVAVIKTVAEREGVWAKIEKIENIIYGKKTNIIFTVKNCNDFSLLIVRYHHLYERGTYLYFDTAVLTEKSEYYENNDNYDLFISNVHKHPRHSKGQEKKRSHLSKDEYDKLDKSKYDHEEDNILVPLNFGNYEYINIWGISQDGIMKKEYEDYLVDNKIIYKYGGWGSDKLMVTRLSDENINYIWSLFDDLTDSK